MTALAKSTEVLQRVGMPSILETIMLQKNKTGEKRKRRKRKKTTHHTNFPNQKNLGVLHSFVLASEILAG